MVSDFGTLILDYGTLIVGVATFFAIAISASLGIRQYREGQKLQKARVLLHLVDSFTKDELVQAACEMLDWDRRHIVVNNIKVPFNNKLLGEALIVPEPFVDDEKRFGPYGLLIRDCFDAFFDFFEKLGAFKKSGLLKLEDYTYFHYWFMMVSDIENMKAKKIPETPKYKNLRIPGIEKKISDYIVAYRFFAAKEMLDEFKKSASYEEMRLAISKEKGRREEEKGRGTADVAKGPFHNNSRA
jgi:hypothetical protein